MNVGRRTALTAIWIVVGAAVLAWRGGWGEFPDASWLATTIVPALPSLPTVDPLAQYSLSSPIGSMVVAALHVRGVGGFEVVHVVAFLALAAVVGVLVVRRWGWTAAGLVGAAFVGSQTAVVLTGWIGSYDVFTVGLTSVLVTVRNRWVAALVGVLLAFAGFEQAAFVLVALAALSLVRVGADRWRLAWAAIGLVVGRVALEVWLRANHITHGRAWFLREIGLGHVLRQFVHGFPWLLVTGLGATVVAVVVAIVHLPSARARIVAIGVLVAALVPTALALDQTRVFAVLTWPIVLVLLVDHAVRSDAAAVRRLSLITLGVAAIVPGIVVWEGRAQLATHHPWRWLWRSMRNP